MSSSGSGFTSITSNRTKSFRYKKGKGKRKETSSGTQEIADDSKKASSSFRNLITVITSPRSSREKTQTAAQNGGDVVYAPETLQTKDNTFEGKFIDGNVLNAKNRVPRRNSSFVISKRTGRATDRLASWWATENCTETDNDVGDEELTSSQEHKTFDGLHPYDAMPSVVLVPTKAGETRRSSSAGSQRPPPRSKNLTAFLCSEEEEERSIERFLLGISSSTASATGGEESFCSHSQNEFDSIVLMDIAGEEDSADQAAISEDEITIWSRPQPVFAYLPEPPSDRCDSVFEVSEFSVEGRPPQSGRATDPVSTKDRIIRNSVQWMKNRDENLRPSDRNIFLSDVYGQTFNESYLTVHRAAECTFNGKWCLFNQVNNSTINGRNHYIMDCKNNTVNAKSVWIDQRDEKTNSIHGSGCIHL